MALSAAELQVSHLWAGIRVVRWQAFLIVFSTGIISHSFFQHQQKRHELEGAPDPFPSLSGQTGPTPVAPSRSRQSQQKLDTGCLDDFPSLSASPAAATQTQPTTSAWATRPRIKPSGVTESFTLPDIDLSGAGKDGRPATLSEVTRGIMQKFKVKIEASTNQKKDTTFYLRSESQKELDKARKALVAICSPVVTLIVQAPASTISVIIGSKGGVSRTIFFSPLSPES